MHPRIAPCIVVILLAALVGCGDEALPEDPMNDAGTPWWEMDASPMTMPDARVECRSDEHLCDDVCVENYPNEPSYGCALGCGEPCEAPMGGVAICGENGRCDILCEAPNMRMGDDCVCQPTTCEEMGRSCGEWDNGCGGTITCGTCADGRACSSAGVCGCSLCACPRRAEDCERSESSSHRCQAEFAAQFCAAALPAGCHPA